MTYQSCYYCACFHFSLQRYQGMQDDNDDVEEEGDDNDIEDADRDDGAIDVDVVFAMLERDGGDDRSW